MRKFSAALQKFRNWFSPKKTPEKIIIQEPIERTHREKIRTNFSLQEEAAKQNMRNKYLTLTQFKAAKAEPFAAFTKHKKAFGINKELTDPKSELIGTTTTRGKTTHWYAERRKQKGTIADRGK